MCMCVCVCVHIIYTLKKVVTKVTTLTTTPFTLSKTQILVVTSPKLKVTTSDHT
jgi:hypothetical protein